MNVVRLKIDGKEVEVPQGTTILQAAAAAGIEIPHLCYHPGLSPAGICRLCLVEAGGKLLTACYHLAEEGMEVFTNTERLKNLRRLNLELILSDHPQDCLTCEKNGACELQRYAYEFGLVENRFVGEGHERRKLLPREDNPFIRYEPEKCILCGRCVRACQEIQGRGVWDWAFRGFSTRVTTGLERPLGEVNCEFCGQCVAVCPTGALTEKARRFQGREWELKRVETVCPFCGCGCPITLHVRGNRLIRVSGGYQGFRLCVKGRFGLSFVHREDRLTKPLIRKGQGFREASWEEALELVAERLLEIRRRYGPDSIGALASAKCTNEENYLFQKMVRAALGTNNVDHCARLCHSPTVAGLSLAFGSGAMTNSIPEIVDADCILVTGSNTTEAHPIVAQEILRAVRHGATLIVVDPRRIELSEKAHFYLQPRPGTDVAWINGFCHVILKEGLWDKKFVAERSEGFEEFAAVVEKYTPEVVEKITGIPGEDLAAAARAFGRAERAMIFYAMGLTQHPFGTENVLAIANLALLTGNVGRPATGVNPLRGQNNVQGACDMGALPDFLPGYQRLTDPAVREKFQRAWAASIPEKPGLTVVEMFEAALKGEIRAMIIMGENPMVSDPDIPHVAEALRKLEFLVVMDIFPNETTAFAHVILPAATFAEKDGTFTNTERRVQRVRKALNPPGEAKPDWQIICELSTRLGYPMRYESPAEIMEEIASLVPIYGGISHSRLESGGLQWPCPTPDHPGTPFLHRDRFPRGLGKFHPVEHREIVEPPDSDFPLILTTGRILWHYHSRTMTGRVDGLQELVPKAYVEINPADAQALGIEEGRKVRVSSRRGSIVIRAKITERVPRGLVFIPFHFGEAAANVLTPASPLDPLAKMPSLKCCAVRVEPAEG
ncbi:MAG: formate dehydrogenase subunit alpha [Candidatus Bipolaricaulaceae bacterium]